jgi:hypothetical protein
VARLGVLRQNDHLKRSHFLRITVGRDHILCIYLGIREGAVFQMPVKAGHCKLSVYPMKLTSFSLFWWHMAKLRLPESIVLLHSSCHTFLGISKRRMGSQIGYCILSLLMFHSLWDLKGVFYSPVYAVP